MINKELNENIQVVVRARPFNGEEVKSGCYESWTINPTTNTISSVPPPSPPPTSTSATKTPSKSTTTTTTTTSRTPAKSSTTSTAASVPGTNKFITNEYTFDHLFLPGIENIDVYTRVAKEYIWSTMEGYNCTIFAYGQTSSGKTYCMKGTGRKNPGIIPLSIQDVFSYIGQTQGREFLLRVSYMEIYNEVINDLLAPESINLKVHEHPQTGEVYVGNLKEEIVLSPEHVMSVIAAGEARRHVGSTNYNDQSSRSHTIFRLVIESKVADGSGVGDGDGGVRVSCLNLIDLAGSEKASQGVDQQRNKEGAYINKSLLTLGTVISKLSEKEKGHIPYRDSKLTRILQTSLGGNSKIAIICTVTLASNNFDETHSTLKFAQRAKKITNNAKVNEIVDDKTLIKQYRNEIAELKLKLEEANKREKEGVNNMSKQSNEEINKKLMEAEKHKNLLESKIQHLTKLILVSTSISSKTKKQPSTGGAVGGSPSSSNSNNNMLNHSSSTLSPSSISGEHPLHHHNRNTIQNIPTSSIQDIDANQIQEFLKSSLEWEEREIQLNSRIAKLELELEDKNEKLKQSGNNQNNQNTQNNNNNNINQKEIELKLKEKDDMIQMLEFKVKGYNEKFKDFITENTKLKKEIILLQQQLQYYKDNDYDGDDDEMY